MTAFRDRVELGLHSTTTQEPCPFRLRECAKFSPDEHADKQDKGRGITQRIRLSRGDRKSAWRAPAGPETFEAVAQKYLAHQKPRISAANYKRERGIVEDHLKPFFAGELRAVRRATVARYITARCTCVSSATVAKELNVLKHLLRLAFEEWEFSPQIRSPEAYDRRNHRPDASGIYSPESCALSSKLHRCGCGQSLHWLLRRECGVAKFSNCAG